MWTAVNAISIDPENSTMFLTRCFHKCNKANIDVVNHSHSFKLKKLLHSNSSETYTFGTLINQS